MPKSYSSSKLLLLLSLFFTLWVSSCSKVDPNYDQIYVMDAGLPGGKATIAAGQQLELHPELTTRYKVIYEWRINGEVVGSDSVYVFTPTEPGTYTIAFAAINAYGPQTYRYEITVLNKYEKGIILVNEGWFGHDNGNVNFYRYGSDTVEQMVYHKENPGKELGVTTQFGAVFNDRLYLVSKQGPLVIADAKSLKETGRIETLPADGRAFAGLDNSTGLISTSDGIYPLNLASLTVGDKLPNISGETGAMKKQGNYLFVLSQSKGAVALKLPDYSVALEIPGMTQGLVTTANGHVWVAGGSSLIDIDPNSLDTTEVSLPFSLGDPWFAWNIGTVTASSKDNAVYIGKTMPWGAGGNEIYKYVPGNASSLQAPFATLPEGKEFYGAGVQYNPENDELAVTAVQSGYGQNYSFNSLYFFDANSASLKKTVNYEYFYFPAMMVFN